jgi:hypothetical protein
VVEHSDIPVHLGRALADRQVARPTPRILLRVGGIAAGQVQVLEPQGDKLARGVGDAVEHRDVRVVISGDRQEHLVIGQDKKLGVVLTVEQVATPAPGPFVLLNQGIVLTGRQPGPAAGERSARFIGCLLTE